MESVSNSRVLAPTRSAMPRMMPNTMSTTDTRYKLRAAVSIWSEKVNPMIAMGRVPMITYQPMRASICPRSSGVYSDRNQVLMMRAMSCRK